MPSLSAAVVVHCCCCWLSPSSLFAVAIVIVRCHRHPSLPSSTSAAVNATLCLCRLLLPALVHPLCSPPLNLACHCRPRLWLSAFAVVIRRHCLLPLQPSSPLCCLHRLSLPTLVLPHCNPLPNHACHHHPPQSSSTTVVVHRCHTSTRPPSYKMLIDAL
jgi:hypothetical protein